MPIIIVEPRQPYAPELHGHSSKMHPGSAPTGMWFTIYSELVIIDRKGRLCFQKRLSVILSTGERGSTYRGVCLQGGGLLTPCTDI